MTAALIFIAAGLALLGLLIFLSLGSGTRFHKEIDPTVATSLLASDATLGSRRIGERICSHQDFDFILKEAPWLRKQFRRERRAISLLWIAQRRRSVRIMVQAYRVNARANVTLRPGDELKLAVNYLSFLAACALAENLVWLSPFIPRSFVSRLITGADRMRSLSEALRGNLGSVQFDEIRNK